MTEVYKIDINSKYIIIITSSEYFPNETLESITGRLHRWVASNDVFIVLKITPEMELKLEKVDEDSGDSQD